MRFGPKHDELGREVPDPRPLELPAGVSRPPTMEEMIQRAIRTQFSIQAAEQGFESFEEADDFEVGDDEPLPFSAHELTEMQEETPIVDEPPAKPATIAQDQRKSDPATPASTAPVASNLSDPGKPAVPSPSS